MRNANNRVEIRENENGVTDGYWEASAESLSPMRATKNKLDVSPLRIILPVLTGETMADDDDNRADRKWDCGYCLN